MQQRPTTAYPVLSPMAMLALSQLYRGTANVHVKIRDELAEAGIELEPAGHRQHWRLKGSNARTQR